MLAGLGALGTTIVEGVEYIDRGYHALEQKLRLLGAKIYREDENSRKYPKML